jgi:electron transfer flavoprotein alpha subunit
MQPNKSSIFSLNGSSCEILPMRALVFLDHDHSDIDRGSLGVLTKAATLHPEQLGAVICGDGPLDSLVEEAARYGATHVHLASDTALGPPLPQPRVDVLADVVQAAGYDTVMFSNSVLAADVAAGLAARLDAGLNWDLTDIESRPDALIGRRPALQDSVLVEVGWRSDRRIALFRPGTFEPEPATDNPHPETEQVPVRLQDHSHGVRIVTREAVPETQGVSITDAAVIVSGGMGLGGPENFALAEQLAELLGGAVGATRAAVYAGWYPRSAQIGQTGQTVSPKLYIALGISGAVQHKVGMQNSKVIVAINKDPGAPIFETADLAVIGDLHTIVPQLTQLLKNRQGS